MTAEAHGTDADLSIRATFPRSIGVSLAINAVPDAYLLIDAPHCAYRRLTYIQGNHDLESTLSLFPGLPRVTNTELTPLRLVTKRDEELVDCLRALAGAPHAAVVLVDAQAMAAITAVDYGRLCRVVSDETGVPVLPVPHRSITSDYLTGYASVLEALAAGLPLEPKPSGRGSRVALVGYFHDRNEADHRANLKELHRTFEALDLELVAVWLSGRPTRELRRVAEADLILSLPYGRRAARVLARRLGCEHVPVDLPFGLSSSIRFVLTLGAVTGREDAARRFIERELHHVLPKLEWLVPFALTHRRLGYIGDPHLYRGVREIAALVGCTVRLAAFTNLAQPAGAAEVPAREVSHELPEDLRALLDPGIDHPDLDPPILEYPAVRTLHETLEEMGRNQEIDLLVTNSFGFLTRRMGVLELGFPSYHTHVLYERPYLGFPGFLAFVERMTNSIRQFEVRAANTDEEPRRS